MAITIDATKGGTSANSYVTRAEADAFLEQIYGAEEWAGLDTTTRDKLLISATKAIDELPIAFDKLADTQALAFPVDTGEATDDGYPNIKEACFWQALYMFENTDAIKEAIAGKIQGTQQEGLSSISKVVTGFNSLSKWNSKALKLLTGYFDFSMTVGTRYTSES